jgi:Uma2 family endonuclease
VREPDLLFISAEKLPLGTRVTQYYEVVPDLVVEIASPSDSRREVNDKARMWHSHGVRLIWAAYPDTRSVDVHLQDGSIATLTENDALDGGNVLPGFTCQVSDIFEL